MRMPFERWHSGFLRKRRTFLIRAGGACSGRGPVPRVFWSLEEGLYEFSEQSVHGQGFALA